MGSRFSEKKLISTVNSALSELKTIQCQIRKTKDKYNRYVATTCLNHEKLFRCLAGDVRYDTLSDCLVGIEGIFSQLSQTLICNRIYNFMEETGKIWGEKDPYDDKVKEDIDFVAFFIVESLEELMIKLQMSGYEI